MPGRGQCCLTCLGGSQGGCTGRSARASPRRPLTRCHRRFEIAVLWLGLPSPGVIRCGGRIACLAAARSGWAALTEEEDLMRAARTLRRVGWMMAFASLAAVIAVPGAVAKESGGGKP